MLVLPAVLGRGRERLVAIAFAVAFLIIPVITQVALWRQVGDVWQGRYVLAVLLLAAIAGGLALDAAGFRFGRPSIAAVRALVVLVSIGQFAAFAFTLRRYAVTNGSWTQFLFDPQWQPPGTTAALTLVVAAALAFAVVAVWRALPRLASYAADQGAIHDGASDGTAFASGSHR